MSFATSDEWMIENLRPPRLTARQRWLAPRLLAFAGAVLFALAAWAPWVTGTQLVTFGPDITHSDDFSFDSSIGLLLLMTRLLHRSEQIGYFDTLQRFFYAWGGVTVLGLLIAPLLWGHAPSNWRRLPLFAFIGWLAAATTVSLVLAVTLLGFQPDRLSAPDLQISVPSHHVGWGLALAAFALVTTWIAVVLLLRELRSPGIIAVGDAAPALSPRRRRVGIGLLTAGVALWLLGFYAIPWVTVNCESLPLTLHHFSEGPCGGLDSADALAFQVVQRVSPETWNLSAGIYPLYGALLGGALLILFAVWRRPSAHIVCIWATVWLLTASAASFLAYRGVGFVITHPPALSSEAQGVWNGATGVAVTLLGLLLAWPAIILLEGAQWWRSAGTGARAKAEPFAASGTDLEITRLRP